MSGRLSYAVVTPAHNEAAHLGQLADAMRAQTISPAEWVIVDNGSTDDTADAVDQITDSIPGRGRSTCQRTTWRREALPLYARFTRASTRSRSALMWS